jgi:DNA-binding transcriptional MocR family regulator
MAVARETPRWDRLFAERTRGDVGEGIAAVLAFLGRPDLISFAGGFPDPLTFPRERASALLEEFAAAGESAAFPYAPTRGLAGALVAVAGRLHALQRRRPAEDELVITSGAIEALELVGKSFLDRSDVVVVEGPTYLGAIQAFRSFEAELVAIPMDEHGLEVDELERRLADGLRPKLVYTIPDHQNPAGVSLSRERRELLVELARRYGFLIIEDVAYRELGFDDETEPSLWALAPDVVLQAGTTSKTLFPGVRLGWAVAPAEVSAELVSAKQNTDQVRWRARTENLRGVRPPRLDRRATRSISSAVPAQVRTDAGSARTLHAGRHALDIPQRRFLLVADASGRRRCRRSCNARRRAWRRHRPGFAVLPGRTRRGQRAAVLQPRR